MTTEREYQEWRSRRNRNLQPQRSIKSLKTFTLKPLGKSLALLALLSLGLALIHHPQTDNRPPAELPQLSP